MISATWGDILNAAATAFVGYGALKYAREANRLSMDSNNHSEKTDAQLLALTKAQTEAAETQTGLAKQQAKLTEHQNQIAEAQRTIAESQAQIEKSMADAEKLPDLKFVVSARIGSSDDIQGYDLLMVNHGKAPAVLSMPRYNKSHPNDLTNGTLVLPIKTKHLLGSTDAERTDHTSDYYDDGDDIKIGYFERAFCNTVVIMPQQQQRFYVGGKQLFKLVDKEKKFGKPFGFFFHESVEKREYLLKLTYDENEGVTISVETRLRGTK